MKGDESMDTWYLDHLKHSREVINKYGELLKISKDDADIEQDIWLCEEICKEESDSILELIDSLLEKEILKQELYLVRKDVIS